MKDIGYHFGNELVGKHYEVLLGRMLDEQGAHCKQGGMNSHSIGVCFVGNFDLYEPPREQWILGVRLVRSLCRICKIQPERIHGHREFAPYKSCPGTQFDIEEFIRHVRRQL
jgi:N-acetyl-anhydromuramyl-L-alanine amidase AmpD